MRTSEIIRQHERAIRILEMIRSTKRELDYLESQSFALNLPYHKQPFWALVFGAKESHYADIAHKQAVIDRLKGYYTLILHRINKINNEISIQPANG